MKLIYFILIFTLIIGLYKYRKSSIIYDFSLMNTIPVRGFLIILVVFHHVFREFPIEIITEQTEYFGKFAVATFFFMSGYGLLVSYMKKGKKYFENFLKTKFSHFLPLLIFLSCLMIPIRYYFGGYYEILNVLFSDLTLLPNSWFIWMLLLEYSLFYIFFNKIPNVLISSIILLIPNIIITILFSYLDIKQFWYARIFSFNLGIFFAIYEKKIAYLFRKYLFYIVFFTIFILLLWCIRPIGRLTYFIDILIPIVFVMICYLFNFKKSIVFRFLGVNSLEIYLYHGILLYFIKEFFC